MHRVCRVFPLILVVLLLSLICGCGDSSPKITVSLASSTSSTTVNAGASAVTITATLAHDSKSAGVTFSLSPTSGCGTLTSSSSTTATYTPPAASTLNANCTATVTAASVSQSSVSTNLAFTVDAISLTLGNSSSTTTLGAGAAAITLTATLGNEASSSDSVAWSMTSTGGSTPATRRPALTSSTCGSLSATTGGTNTYTPPTAPLLSTACTATVTAASTINGSITKSVTFTVNPLAIALIAPASTAVLEGSASGAITAALSSNSTSDSTLNWSLSPSNCGALAATTGTSNAFTPTAPIPTGCSSGATVTVAADAAPQINKSVVFTITPITASISPSSAQTVVEGGTQAFTITTTDPSSVNWTLASGSCGWLTSATVSGVTYTAPKPISAACTATLVATSKTDNTVAPSVGITVNPITVAISSPTSPVSVQSGATATSVTATTTDPAGVATLAWTLNPSTGCGSLSATTGATNSYTPPTTLAAACSAVATAASSTDSAKTASVTFNVTPAPIALTLLAPTPSSGNTASSTVSYAGTLAVSATLYNDANNQGIGYTLSSGCGSFTGMSLTSTSGATTTYSGTYTAPTSSCTGTLALAANAATSQTATVSLTVQPGISVTLSPAGPVNMDANNTLSITPTVNYDAASKGVNLSLSPASGCGSLSAATANSGTAFTYTAPTTLSSNCTATITAASQSDTTKTAALSVTVYPALALQSTTALGSVYTGESFNGAINVSGGLAPYTWTVTGGGDNIVAGTSTSSYVPITSSNVTSATATATVPDTITFNVSVKDANNVTVSGTYTLSVYAYTAVSLTSTTLTGATNGQSYSAGINAIGGVQTYHFTVNGTTIPTAGTATTISNAYGLTGSNTGGNTLTIAGTPSVSSTPATITLNVSVTDGETQTGSGTYTIAVAAQSTLAYTAANLYQAQGMAGMPYSAGINWSGSSDSVISGGTQPYTLTFSGLPGGLTADSHGNITGTPSAAANTTVNITVKDSSATQQTLSKTFVIPVVAATTAAYNSRISGQYACELHEAIDSGYTGGNGSTLYMKARAFAIAVDGSGNITGGEADTNGPSGYKFSSSVTGTYVVGSDNRGTMTVSGNIFALAGGALDSYGQFTQFHFIDMDDAGSSPTGKHGGGVCFRQYNSDGTAVTSSSNTLGSTTLANRWVFAMNGESGSGIVETQVGSLNLNSSTGVVDSMSGSSVDSNLALTVSGTTSLDSWGRFTVTAGPSGGSNTLAIYITNQTYGKAVGVTTGSHMSTSNADMFWGQLRVQNHTDIAASYPLTGNFVLYTSGLADASGPYKAMVAQGTGGPSATTITVNALAANSGGTIKLNGTPVGAGALAYTADGNTGRTYLNNVSGIIFYLYDTNQAAVLFDDGENLLGWLEKQGTPTSGTWTNAVMGSSSGTRYSMGQSYNGDQGSYSGTGVLVIASSGSINSMAEDNSGVNYSDWDESFSGQYGILGTAAFVPDTTLDSSAAYGVFDVNFTPAGSSAQTMAYCVAASASSAYSSSDQGRALCVDAQSKSPRIMVSQE